MPGEPPDLSIVLPCRDQGDHIAAALHAFQETLEPVRRPYELVVVPNACADDTGNIVASLAARDERVRMVALREGGWGRAVRCGLAAARGEILCFANSARTDPAHVVELLAVYERNAPCLAKVQRSRRVTSLRRLGSTLYNLEARAMFSIAATDVNGTPKMFSRDLWGQLRLRSPGDLLDLELLAQATRLGTPIVEMPIASLARRGGRSTTTLWSAVKMYAGAVALRCSR
ncbi:MAG TPA: glycosyltransferase [Candidatus Methylomirabilis sp.]|nr:glycosyltransferase [Candidatus Methylomirabilis sp.]